jgi:dCMP deaminase
MEVKYLKSVIDGETVSL